jgi:hypothetical protein
MRDAWGPHPELDLPCRRIPEWLTAVLILATVAVVAIYVPALIGVILFSFGTSD